MGRWGFFISVEGIEGSGKTTLADNIYKKLKEKGFPVLLTREPGGTGVGDKIREVLLHSKEKIDPLTELFLFLASRREHVKEKILPALREGKIVICDRFTDSTLAYQGFGRGINLDFIRRLNKVVTENIKPDITLLIDLSVEEGMKRVKDKDRIEKEETEFHEKVRKGFLSIAKRSGKRIFLINGNLPEKEILEIAFNKIIQRLYQKKKYLSILKQI